MKTGGLPQLRPYTFSELAEALAIRPLTLHEKMELFKAEIGEPEDSSNGKHRYSVKQVKLIFEKLFV